MFDRESKVATIVVLVVDALILDTTPPTDSEFLEPSEIRIPSNIVDGVRR
ncbi:MAG: hypothetical protein NT100_09375 [Rhodococcus sp.]|nr:hypothetical protein [Rhodococcus sp. (in: high G+C Gram-positive bacteria)]MBP2523957.1 hypothetical protein [Rhodococcus sp. PvP104]MCX6473757.1 hypothetical protein [Rhodococcus sp. (in: high G+C Gram-positive bacteria)]